MEFLLFNDYKMDDLEVAPWIGNLQFSCWILRDPPWVDLDEITRLRRVKTSYMGLIYMFL